MKTHSFSDEEEAIPGLFGVHCVRFRRYQPTVVFVCDQNVTIPLVQMAVKGPTVSKRISSFYCFTGNHKQLTSFLVTLNRLDLFPCMSMTTGPRCVRFLVAAQNAEDDDDEVMLNVLRCQLTY